MTAKKTIATSATLGALAALGVAGCGTSVGEAVESAADPLTFGVVSETIYGADSLYYPMVDTFYAGGSNCDNLIYVGTSSDNGELCLRDMADCPNSPHHQNFAPMSRSLTGGGTGPSESQQKIGLDGMAVWANTTAAPTSLSIPALRSLLCAPPPGSCSKGLEAGKVYVPDASSEASTGLRALLGACANPCTAGSRGGNLCEVTSYYSMQPRIACNSSPYATMTSSQCSTFGMTASECIARLIANDPTAIGYGEASQLQYAPQVKVTAIPISVTNGGTAVSMSQGNIRKLITDPSNAYPLSRFLYLSTNNVRRPAEGTAAGATSAARDNNSCYNWMTTASPVGGADNLERSLQDGGFIVCNTSATLDCTP